MESFWKWLLIFVGLLAAAALASIVIVSKKSKNGDDIPEIDQDNDEKFTVAEENEKKSLIDKYLKNAENIEIYKSDEVYRKKFGRYCTFYQTVCGLNRQKKTENLSDDQYLYTLDITIDNSDIAKDLDENGFTIKTNVTKKDRKGITEKLLMVEPKLIKRDIDHQNALLQDLSVNEFFKHLLENTGKSVYQVVRTAKSDTAACIQYSAQVEEKMIESGCVPIFSDNKLLAENTELRLSFYDDNPDVTELPRLCRRLENGKYAPIGNPGTQRVKA